jgi:hypothetical protein
MNKNVITVDFSQKGRKKKISTEFSFLEKIKKLIPFLKKPVVRDTSTAKDAYFRKI